MCPRHKFSMVCIAGTYYNSWQSCKIRHWISKSKMNQPKIKRRVGKYEVGRTIGEGTFAKVKFARNSETGEPVALKILDKEKVLKHKMAEQVYMKFFSQLQFTLSLSLVDYFFCYLWDDRNNTLSSCQKFFLLGLGRSVTFLNYLPIKIR